MLELEKVFISHEKKILGIYRQGFKVRAETHCIYDNGNMKLSPLHQGQASYSCQLCLLLHNIL